VPGVGGPDPYGSAGGPKCVLVPDMSAVTKRASNTSNSKVVGGTHKLTGNWQEETLASTDSDSDCLGTSSNVKIIPRLAATIFAGAAGLGLMGVGVATDAQAQPGPFPQWCPGEFWDPGWGNNWDWNNCHDWRGGPGPGGWDRDQPGGPGWDRDHPGGPGWDHDHPGPGGPWQPNPWQR
jgi:hypothetical protein